MSLKQMAAFKKDCEELIKKFLEKKSLKFDDFASVWREMKFSYIFFGQRPLGLIRQFSEDALVTAKYYWLKSDNLPESIAGLYLVYGLYFKNRLPGLIHIPLTLDDLQLVYDFSINLTDSSHKEAAFIMQKLFDNEAFHFSACSNSYGMERQYRLQTHNSNHLPKVATFSNDYCALKEFIPVYNQYLESKKEIMGVVEDLSLSKTFLSQILPDFICIPGISTDVLNISQNVDSPLETNPPETISSANKRRKTNKDCSALSSTSVLNLPENIGDYQSNESYIITNDESVNLVSTLGEFDVIGPKGKETKNASRNKSVKSAKVKSDGAGKSKILTEEISDMLKTLDCASSSHAFEESSGQKSTHGSDFSWIFRDDNDSD